MRGLKPLRTLWKDYMDLSHLLQMRGLKHFRLDGEHHRHKVASFTDAWIETSVVFQLLYVFLSHLLQMRGLKHEVADVTLAL